MPLFQSIIRGVVLGFVIVMPGMSGGTALVILGVFEPLVRDLARLRIAPYLPLIGGLVVGIFVGGMTFARLLIFYRDLTAAFFLGIILASVVVILKGRPLLRTVNLSILLAGLAAGCLFAGEPFGLAESQTTVNPFLLFFGGALASAAMLIPGVPGSAVLIIMGIYDDMLIYLNDLNITFLLIFGLGSIAGIFVLARVLAKYYDRYEDILSFLFAGLITGSARIILPQVFTGSVVISLAAGVLLVWCLSKQ